MCANFLPLCMHIQCTSSSVCSIFSNIFDKQVSELQGSSSIIWKDVSLKQSQVCLCRFSTTTHVKDQAATISNNNISLWTNLTSRVFVEIRQNRENSRVVYSLYIGKGKGKAVPLQAWSDPEGSRKLRFPDFMTTAQDGGMVVSLTHRPPLPPGNSPGTHFC